MQKSDLLCLSRFCVGLSRPDAGEFDGRWKLDGNAATVGGTGQMDFDDIRLYRP